MKSINCIKEDSVAERPGLTLIELISLGFLIQALAAPFAVHAALVPYNVDAATLHLWHLDEPATPCVDSAPGGTNLTALSGSAALNQTSFTGFGTALSTIDGGQNDTSGGGRNAVLSGRTLSSGAGDNVLTPFAHEASATISSW